jgi:hypothetical protein
MAVGPRTSQGAAFFRMSVLPSVAQIESLTRPLHSTKIPRGIAHPRTGRAFGVGGCELDGFKGLSAEVGKSQKIRPARNLQVRQLSMISSPYDGNTTFPILPGPPKADTASVPPSARPICPSGPSLCEQGDQRHPSSVHPSSHWAL